MEVRHYVAVAFRGEEGFGVVFPDLPGCTSYGRTIQEAAVQAEIALNGHIALMAKDGEPLPNPTPWERLEGVIVDPEDEEAARFLVKVEIPGRWVRVNISMADNLVARIDRTAKMLGMSRSGYLAEAARRMLEVELDVV